MIGDIWLLGSKDATVETNYPKQNVFEYNDCRNTWNNENHLSVSRYITSTKTLNFRMIKARSQFENYDDNL